MKVHFVSSIQGEQRTACGITCWPDADSAYPMADTDRGKPIHVTARRHEVTCGTCLRVGETP